MDDALIIGGRELRSRLFLGTGKFGEDALIPNCIAASGAQVITTAMRRIDFHTPQENMMQYIPKDCILMPQHFRRQNCGGGGAHRTAVACRRLRGLD